MKLWQDWQAAAIIDDNSEVLEVEICKKKLNKEEVAKRLRLLTSGVLLDEAKHLIQRYPEAKLIEMVDPILESLELPYPNEERMQILDEAALLLSAQDVDEAASDPDRRLEHLIRASDELRGSWVLLEARLTEWVVLLLPRARMEADRNRLAKLIMSSETISDLAEHFEVTLPPKPPSESEWLVIKNWAETVASMQSQLDRIESTVRDLSLEHLPSLSAIAGPMIAARLCVAAHGRMRLARLPAGTVQILGAEKAFFSHLKHGTKPPKHGLIYSHVLISRSPKPIRGRVSRMLAARMSLAARIDAFNGTPWGEEELRNIEERVEGMRQQYFDSKKA
jgi:nucleolar protein 56